MKSPLRYPGGKQKLAKEIIKYIPENTTVLDPFFGGGSVPLLCLSRGQKVLGSDGFEPLVNFWAICKIDQERLLDELNFIRKGSTDEDVKANFGFYRTQSQQTQNHNAVVSAASFFVVNRCSFSGATLSGGFSLKACSDRFTNSSIKRIESLDLTNLKFCENPLDYSDALDSLTPHPFLYLDPPYYAIKGLYGNKGDMSFGESDHLDLANLLHSIPNKFALSYNDCIEIRELYKGFKFIELSPSKSMSNGKKSCPEVLIIKE
jgi:DNA adenine methylase